MGNLRRQLIWLIILRLVLVTSLLISQFFLETLLPSKPVWTGGAFYLILGAPFFLTVFYLLFFRLGLDDRIHAHLQFLGDVVVITGIVIWTGGMFSPFVNLFFVVVLVAASLLYRNGALLAASEAFIAYGLVVFLTLERRLQPIPALDEQYRALTTSQAYFQLFLWMFGLYAVAYLTSRLSESLRGERSRAERSAIRVRELEAFHRTLVESMTVGLMTSDEEGGITFASESAEAILGVGAEELEGRHLDDVLLEPGGFGELRIALGHRSHVRTESSRSRAGEDDLRLGITASRLGGPVAGMLLLVEDLTELRRLEEELRLKDRMAALGEMAAALAHEIRNPLASMTGSVEVLSEDLDLAGDQERLLGIVQKESKRLDGIIRDFLQYARPSSLQRDRIDLVELAQETVDLFRHSAEVAEDVRLSVRGDESVICEADPNQIRQVVWNLLRNSRDAMPDGGELTVEVAQEQNTVRMSVRDTGEGMSEEDRLAAIQPFHSPSGRGVGLGLTIVYRIVRDHGGWIEIQSEKHQGTEVVVLLPERGRTPRETPSEAAS